MTESPSTLSAIALAVHWVIVIAVSLRVLARRLPIGVSLAWLAVVYAVPFFGAAVYLVLGGKRLNDRWRARHSAAERAAAPMLRAACESPYAVTLTAESIGRPLAREAMGVLGTPVLTSNTIQLVCESEQLFDTLIADIDRAQSSCRIAYYIWQNGGRSDDVLAAIVRAQGRGVHCRVLLDAYGSAAFLRSPNCTTIVQAGARVVAALPSSWRRRADIRYHRKNVVIDDRIAFTGSQNLVDPRYFKRSAGVGRWVDAMVRIEGPAVSMLARQFEIDWATDEPGSSNMLATTLPDVLDRGVMVQVVPSGPAPLPDVIRQLTLTAIYSARHTLSITTPYFVPDDAVLTALRSASSAGVVVTIIVPAENDSFLVRHASASAYEELLLAGIRLFRYHGGLLHTKSLVVDGAVSLFGSVNLDMRSFWLDFEMSLFIYDEAFAAELHALHESYVRQSVLLDAETWQRQPKRNRLLENAARLAGPLL